MVGWAAAELRHVDLGDKRRNQRLIQIVEDLAAQPSTSVPQASRDMAAMQGTYDFWKCPQVNPDAILAGHRQASLERIAAYPVVLAVQDTTEFNFTTQRQKRGMGPLDHPKTQGLKCHSLLGVSPDGLLLGILHQNVWARPQASQAEKSSRARRATAEKESQRWLDSLRLSQQFIPDSTQVVTVGDREADIYDLFAFAQQQSAPLLVRAAQDRWVRPDPDSELVHLNQAIAAVPPVAQTTLLLQRQPNRPARQAMLTLRFTQLEVQPPKSRPVAEKLQPIPLQVILAQEEQPPAGEPPICWLLLTSLPISNLDDVLTYLRWYTYRWLIERYHYVLKSGCLIEKLQLETAERIHRALATYSLVAWRLLSLTYEARHRPEASCEDYFEPHEWQALYCFIHKTVVLPTVPPNLRQCVRWIAQLGGFIGRKLDGEPGVKTLWRGLRRLYDIASTWKLSHPTLYGSVNPLDVKKDAING